MLVIHCLELIAHITFEGYFLDYLSSLISLDFLCSLSLLGCLLDALLVVDFSAGVFG